jgi:uncharacterized protein
MRTLTVTGHGAATAVPDTAVVRVSAVHRGATLAEALAGAESARAGVVAAAEGLVVGTLNLSIWPAHDPEGRPDGFEARHQLEVSTADLDRANDLLARLAAEVGDRLTVDGVQLAVRDATATVGQAREAAFVDARERAEHLAALADAELDKVVEVVEGGAPTGGAPRALAAKADVGLQPGESTIASAVTVTWRIRSLE